MLIINSIVNCLYDCIIINIWGIFCRPFGFLISPALDLFFLHTFFLSRLVQINENKSNFKTSPFHRVGPDDFCIRWIAGGMGHEERNRLVNIEHRHHDWNSVSGRQTVQARRNGRPWSRQIKTTKLITCAQNTEPSRFRMTAFCMRWDAALQILCIMLTGKVYCKKVKKQKNKNGILIN